MKSKYVFITVESILFILFLYLIIINYNIKTTSQFAISMNNGVVELSTFFVVIGIYVFGILSGFVYSMVLGSRYKDQIEFYARKTEKLSVQNEIDTDEREALQRKIASLEIALDNALKNKK